MPDQVVAQIPFREYTANGVTTVFAFDFEVPQAVDLVVYANAVAVPGSSYVLAGVGVQAGGTVTFNVAPLNGVKVLLNREIALARTTGYQTLGDFRAVVVNPDFNRLWMALQGFDAVQGGAIRAPYPMQFNELPNPAAFSGYYIGLNGASQPAYLLAPSGTAAALAGDLANTSNAALGDALIGVRSSLTGGTGRTQHSKNADTVSVKDFGAVGDGVANDAAAIQVAINAAAGRPLHFPAGTYRVDTGLTYVTTAAGVFTPGLQIFGDGPGVTIFDNRVASGFLFRCATNTLSNFQHTVKFKDFQIITTTSPATSGGISLRSCYNTSIENVWIKGLTGDGIKVIVANGDPDASNMMSLFKVRIETCAGWGFNTEVTGAFNEFSFLSLMHTFIQGCGTNSATVPPPSGGMRWKGQVFGLRDCGFTINENVGLFIQGGAGLANTVVIEGTAFENNRRKHIYCDGLDGFTMRRSQLYSNDSFVAQNGVQFEGASFAVRGVDIEGTIVRATTANNAYTAFSIGGGLNLDTLRVRNTIWQNFEFAGQTRFSGFQFDKIAQDCDLVALSTTSVVFRPNQGFGRGNKTPLRMRGSIGGTPSTTGEWVALQVAAGGISISNASLANSTRYYCYLFDNAGVPSLELSTTIFAVDSASGYNVKTGDATRLYVGSVQTDGAAAFLLTAGGWLNPVLIPASQVGVFNRVWADATNRLMIRGSGVVPTSDTDGTVVGTQV